MTKTADEEGLKTMSWPMTSGPGGTGVGSLVSVWGMGRRGPRGVRPFVDETEKQVNPAVAPLLSAQAEIFIEYETDFRVCI